MKFFTVLSLILIGFFFSHATAAGWNTLVVDVRNDDPFVVDLSETLAVRVDDGSLILSDPHISYEIPLGDIVSVTHRKAPYNIPTSAYEVNSESSSPSIALATDSVCLSGFPVGSRCVVYDISGKLIMSVDFDGEYFLPVSTLGKGIFVVNAGEVSLKISNQR